MTDAENPTPLWGTPEAPVRGRPPWGPPSAQPPGNGSMSPIPQWNPPPGHRQPSWNQPAWNQPQWNPAQWNQAQWNRPAPRDLVIAYALLVLLGTFGLHRFYLRSNGMGGFYLALGLAGWSISRLPAGPIDTGLLLLIPLWLLLLVDFVTLPGQVRRANLRL